MTLEELKEKVDQLYEMTKTHAEKTSTSLLLPDNTKVNFLVSDRSEGTTIDVDQVDKIELDLMKPGEVNIHLS